MHHRGGPNPLHCRGLVCIHDARAHTHTSAHMMKSTRRIHSALTKNHLLPSGARRAALHKRAVNTQSYIHDLNAHTLTTSLCASPSSVARADPGPNNTQRHTHIPCQPNNTTRRHNLHTSPHTTLPQRKKTTTESTTATITYLECHAEVGGCLHLPKHRRTAHKNLCTCTTGTHRTIVRVCYHTNTHRTHLHVLPLAAKRRFFCSGLTPAAITHNKRHTPTHKQKRR